MSLFADVVPPAHATSPSRADSARPYAARRSHRYAALRRAGRRRSRDDDGQRGQRHFGARRQPEQRHVAEQRRRRDARHGARFYRRSFPFSFHLLTIFYVVEQRVRVGALKYLAVLPKIVRYDVLHPQKAVVLRELAKALDDPKRVVRKEAVDARSVWFPLMSLCLLHRRALPGQAGLRILVRGWCG